MKFHKQIRPIRFLRVRKKFRKKQRNLAYFKTIKKDYRYTARTNFFDMKTKSRYDYFALNYDLWIYILLNDQQNPTKRRKVWFVTKFKSKFRLVPSILRYFEFQKITLRTYKNIAIKIGSFANACLFLLVTNIEFPNKKFVLER